MNIIFFSNAGNVIFRRIFLEKTIFAFLTEGNFIFERKRNTILTNIPKTLYFYILFEKYHLSFSVHKKNIIFSGKRNVIFPHDIRKIIFQCNFLGKTIFSEHLKNISYFHMFFFWERASFIFRLKNNIIVSGKRDIIFPDDTKKIIFQWDFFGKIIFSEHLKKEDMVFCAVFAIIYVHEFCYDAYIFTIDVRSCFLFYIQLKIHYFLL